MGVYVFENMHKNIKTAVEEIINEEGFTEYDITNPTDIEKGFNYLGVMVRLKVTGTKSNNEKATLNLICKLATKTEETRERIPIAMFYMREIFTYEKVLPSLDEIGKSYITDGDDLFRFVRCYKTSQNLLEEFIIMEDVSEGGFVMHDRKKPMNLEHLRIAVRSVARLHALSFSLKERDPVLYGDIAENLKGDVHNSDNLRRFITISKNAAVIEMNAMPYYKEKLENFQDSFEKMNYCSNTNTTAPYNVLCHGDFWINNILFKYNEGAPVDTRLVDWQMMKHCSPFVDLYHLIFSCTDAELRTSHLDSILDEYYVDLGGFLDQLNCDISVCYPKEVFKNQSKIVLPYGLVMSFVSLGLLVRESDEVLDLDTLSRREIVDECDFLFKSSKSQNAYQERMKGIIDDFVRLLIL